MWQIRKIRSDKCPGLVGQAQDPDVIHRAIQPINLDAGTTKKNTADSSSSEAAKIKTSSKRNNLSLDS